MDLLDMAQKIWMIVGTPSLLLIGYQYNQLRKINDRVDKMITREEMVNEMSTNDLLTKERLAAKVEPIADKMDDLSVRLDRLADKIDALIQLKLTGMDS